MDMAHIKLLAAELRSLTIYPTIPPSFSRSSISRTEILGIVVSLESKPKFLKFLLDDDFGCIPCFLWLNNRHVPSDQNLKVKFTSCHAQMVKLGEQLRVRGRITVYRGGLQITIRDVLVERDPNMETLHRLDCVRIAQQFTRCDSLATCINLHPVIRKCKREKEEHNLPSQLKRKIRDFVKDTMLGEKRRLVESSNKKAYLPEGSYTTVPGTISAQGGSTVNISAFISHLDDTTKKRLDRMNQRLRQLELQMEAIEAEMTKASEE